MTTVSLCRLERSQDRVFGYPSLVRFSWSTCREALIKGGAVKVAWECEEDANADAVGTPEISSFFSGTYVHVCYLVC